MPSFTGKAEFRLTSPITIYSLILQGVIVTLTCLTFVERIKRMEDPSLNFGDLVLETGCVICFSFAFLVPTSHMPECAKKARFLNNWSYFQAS